MERIGVIGAGIVGLAVARRLQQLRPDASVSVLEKQATVARHQSGHNSGVVHAGLYYLPGSLKARLCTRGRDLLRAYCEDHGLPYHECGKLVVARDQSEVPALAEIERRARANGVPGLRRLAAGEIASVEPHCRGVAAVHSPRTAITDFAAVCRCLAAGVVAAGGRLRLGWEVNAVTSSGRPGGIVVGSLDDEVAFDRLVVCAGLQADRVARLAGDDVEPRIIPFRGEYLRLAAHRTGLVRGLIYPVPDPAYPFLGVHLTRRVDGGVDIGPNAVLATAREGYRRVDFRLGDVWDVVRSPGMRRLARRHWRTGVGELRASLWPRALVAEAQRFVPDLDPADVEAAGAGVRAQAVDADGSLVDDFRIGGSGRVVTVRNAPSPAATSALAIAEHVAALVLDRP